MKPLPSPDQLKEWGLLGHRPAIAVVRRRVARYKAGMPVAKFNEVFAKITPPALPWGGSDLVLGIGGNLDYWVHLLNALRYRGVIRTEGYRMEMRFFVP